jgi:hypothetical protein
MFNYMENEFKMLGISQVCSSCFLGNVLVSLGSHQCS